MLIGKRNVLFNIEHSDLLLNFAKYYNLDLTVVKRHTEDCSERKESCLRCDVDMQRYDLIVVEKQIQLNNPDIKDVIDRYHPDIYHVYSYCDIPNYASKNNFSFWIEPDSFLDLESKIDKWYKENNRSLEIVKHLSLQVKIHDFTEDMLFRSYLLLWYSKGKDYAEKFVMNGSQHLCYFHDMWNINKKYYSDEFNRFIDSKRIR